MKFVISISAFIISASAWSQTCAQISGVYQMAEGSVMKYEQTGCETLTRTAGYWIEGGGIRYTDSQVISLDGRQYCQGKNCFSVEAKENSLNFSLQYQGIVKASPHGLCNYQSNSLALNSDGNLESTYQTSDCDDGFAGPFTKVFARVEP